MVLPAESAATSGRILDVQHHLGGHSQSGRIPRTPVPERKGRYMHAEIVGGGIGGLAAALALRQNGWSVSVQEKSAAPDPGGTAVVLWPEAMAALDQLGLGAAVRELAAQADGAALLDARGRVLAGMNSARGSFLIPRNALHRVLADALPAGTVRWGVPVLPGSAETAADLLVGADGIHSTVRSTWWPSSPARPLGTVAYRGVIDREARQTTETWMRGALFGITPAGRSGLNWFACLRGGPVAAGDALHTLQSRFRSAHPAIREVLEAVEPDGIDRRVLMDVSVPGSYVRGRTVLLGDAAHAMAPNLGRGACEALRDAVALGTALPTGRQVEAGLREYDRSRRPATSRMVMMARILNRLATAERGVAVRDGVLRLASTALPGSRPSKQ